MLEIGHTRAVTEASWSRLPSRVQLPVSQEEFFALRGPLPVHPESRRRFHRFYLRGLAILRYQGHEYAGYAKDISRMGLGFYSPIQLFPCDEVTILMPEREPILAEVTRCLRIGNACYECGTVFARAGDEGRS